MRKAITKTQIITEDELEVMHLIEEDPIISQRILADRSGFSIGKVNYCLKGLANIGYIKIGNFRKSNNKLNYAYVITPKGIEQKIAITKKFIAKKRLEYDRLTSYLNK